jgi:O-methyltransferase
MNYQKKQQSNHKNNFLKVVDPHFLKYYEKIRKDTMLSPEALYDLWWSVKYICGIGLQGDVVEFGVWKGGGLEIIGYALNHFKGTNKIIGYDSFEGHPKPESDEFDIWGNNMQKKYHEETQKKGHWAYANYDYVFSKLKNLYINLELHKGFVNNDINENIIKSISILRLDMDWYNPTKICLNKFYDKIEVGGILIVDDYGHHSGARQAVDEFLMERNLHLNFRHVNYSCIAATII